MPCRTAPEIDEERQRFLAGRRAVQPGIVKGNYPFRDERGSIIGLLIEIVLIATFTQRLFTRRHLGRHLLPLGRGVVRV